MGKNKFRRSSRRAALGSRRHHLEQGSVGRDHTLSFRGVIALDVLDVVSGVALQRFQGIKNCAQLQGRVGQSGQNGISDAPNLWGAEGNLYRASKLLALGDCSDLDR